MISPITERDNAIPLAQVSVAFSEGSVSDPTGKEGATRLLLQLMRRGSGGQSAEEIDETVDRLGASLGVEVSRSVSALNGGVISRSRSSFLRLLETMLLSPNFDEKEFHRLKEETHASWVESLNDDATLARRFFSRALFEGHAYGRPAAGTPTTLARLELDDIVRQYRRIIHPESLHIGFSGDVEEEESQTFARKVQEKLNPLITETSSLTDPSGPEGRTLLFVDKPERSQTQILIGGLGTHPRDDDHTALYVGHTIFGGTFSGRLSQEVRGKRGWSYGAYSSLPFDKKRQAFSLWTFPQTSDAPACIKLELQMLQELVDGGVTQGELDAAKSYLANSHAFSIDTASKRASQRLDQQLYELPDGYFDSHIEQVKALSVDDVNAALRSRLSAENLVFTIVGTKDDLLANVEDSIDDLRSTRIVAFDSED